MQRRLDAWAQWGSAVDFDTASGSGVSASGEGRGFALKHDDRWFAVWSDGLQLVFQAGAQQWPMTGVLNAAVKGEKFVVMRDDEVVFDVAYRHAQYDPTKAEDDVDVTGFFTWAARLWSDENMKRAAIEKWA